MKEKQYTLGDFVEVPLSSMIDPQSSSYDRFVGLEHYDSHEPVITRYSGKEILTSSVKEFKRGDILIARRNVYLERSGVAIFDGITSGDSIILRVKEDIDHNTGIPAELVKRILPFVLNSNSFWAYANRHADGMNSKRISKDKILDFEFNLPSIEYLSLLSDKLWAAYELKRSYQDIIKATDEMVKSQFIEMFGGNQYKQAELDTLAKDWQKGQAFKKDNLMDDGKYKCIHYGELFTKYGPIIDSVLSSTDDNMIKGSKKGDILFPASDVTPVGLARCSALMLDDVLLGGDIIVLRPQAGIIPEYLSWAINMQKDQLLKRVTGSVVRHMSAKGLKSVTVPIPPKEIQQHFISIVKQADKSKFELKKAIEAIDKVIKSLINENL